MVPKCVSYFLFYYRLCGFHPECSVNKRQKLLNSLILMCHIVLSVWCAIRAYGTFIEEQSIMEFLDAFNFFTYYLNLILLYWLIIYDSYINRNTENKFWQIFFQINNKFCSHTNFQIRTYLISLVILTFANVFVLLFSILRKNSVGSAASMTMHHILIYIFDQRLFFYVLHLKMIASELWAVKFELIQVKRLNRYNQNNTRKARSMMCKFEEKGFKRIREYYELVHEMSSCVNICFGWSHLALIIMSFHSLVTFLNFIYGQLHDKFSRYNSGQWWFCSNGQWRNE